MERKSPQSNFRDERLDVLAGTRGRPTERAVRLGELGELVVKMLPVAAVTPPLVIPPLDVPTQRVALGANVSLSVTGTFYAGPALTLEPGRYLILASVLHERAGTTSETITARIWDGAAAIARSAGYRPGTTGVQVGVSMTAVVTIAATVTLTVQAATSSGNAASLMLASDTHITALRIGE